MKLPKILGTVKDFEAPTRRKFLQGAGAFILPKPPIDVGGILRDTLNTQEGGDSILYSRSCQ